MEERESNMLDLYCSWLELEFLETYLENTGWNPYSKRIYEQSENNANSWGAGGILIYIYIYIYQDLYSLWFSNMVTRSENLRDT